MQFQFLSMLKPPQKDLECGGASSKARAQTMQEEREFSMEIFTPAMSICSLYILYMYIDYLYIYTIFPRYISKFTIFAENMHSINYIYT